MTRGRAPRSGTTKKGSWSAHELARLEQLYPRCREDRVAELIGRSVDSVRRRAASLFKQPPRRGEWTADEDMQLRVSWGVLDARAIGLVLGRSQREVKARARAFRQARAQGEWTRRERAMLRQLYGSRSDAALEVCLSRPRREIAAMALELCLQKDKRLSKVVDGAPPRMPRWTAEEVERLTELYPDSDNLSIARALGRSVTSVANKASQLGLRKSDDALRDMGQRNVAVRYRR